MASALQTRRHKGQLAEERALRYLLRRGYRLITVNFTTDEGEIDLILWDRQTLVFAEVRSRQSEDFMSPEQSVDRPKQDRILAAARFFRHVYHLTEFPHRFDVIAISANDASAAGIRHSTDAFRPWYK